HRVKQVPTCHQLNRISNDLSTDQGGLHPFGTHGHTVRDCDSVVLNRCPTGGANTGLDVLGQVMRIERTGHHLDPGMRHADEWSRQVFVGEANGLEHGSGRRTVRTVGNVTTVVFEGISHGTLAPVGKIRVCITAQAGALWYYLGQHSPYDKGRRMVLSQLCPAHIRWL